MVLNMEFVVFWYFSVLSKVCKMSLYCFMTLKTVKFFQQQPLLWILLLFSFLPPEPDSSTLCWWMNGVNVSYTISEFLQKAENVLCKHPIVKTSRKFLKVMFKSCFKWLIVFFIFGIRVFKQIETCVTDRKVVFFIFGIRVFKQIETCYR